jgi:hypothetical protein
MAALDFSFYGYQERDATQEYPPIFASIKN